ncbi:MAG: ABC transporter ATP-binding protein [Pseudomonadota bacterium]
MNILDVKHLTKEFGKFTAVNDISFSIPQGVCFGLLGPNGAGKTTTIEIIEGIIPATSGDIRFNGTPITRDFNQHAGIQFQQTSLPDYLSTVEILSLFRSFYTNPLSENELIALCDLGEFTNTYATRLSGGQRQRLLLALALINDPSIIFLDEPTTGLDPQSRRRFWQLINRVKEQGKTVLLTTHYMEEASFLCDELIIMDHGQIIAQGTPDRLLLDHFDSSYISLNYSSGITREIINSSSIDPESVTWLEEKCLIFSAHIHDTIRTLIDLNVQLNDIQIQHASLEDLFLKLTGHSLRE